jgi:hypothetical protein
MSIALTVAWRMTWCLTIAGTGGWAARSFWTLWTI